MSVNTKLVKYLSVYINYTKFNIGHIENRIGYARGSFSQHHQLLLNQIINREIRVISLNKLVLHTAVMHGIKPIHIYLHCLYKTDFLKSFVKNLL